MYYCRYCTIALHVHVYSNVIPVVHGLFIGGGTSQPRSFMIVSERQKCSCTYTHTRTYTHTLQPGFQINSELLNGRNALHYAADYGQAEVIKYLIQKGAKLDVSVYVSVSVCMCVCFLTEMEGGEKEERREGERERERKRGLHSHYFSLSPSTTQLPDKHSITALLAAVYEDHVDCVRVLVSSVSYM